MADKRSRRAISSKPASTASRPARPGPCLEALDPEGARKRADILDKRRRPVGPLHASRSR